MPVVKWVGGKRQLLDALAPLLPQQTFKTYCEPFIGGGALLFCRQPSQAIANDINFELINMYFPFSSITFSWAFPFLKINKSLIEWQESLGMQKQ